MGIIKAVKQAIGGGFADTWQEVIEPDNICLLYTSDAADE